MLQLQLLRFAPHRQEAQFVFASAIDEGLAECLQWLESRHRRLQRNPYGSTGSFGSRRAANARTGRRWRFAATGATHEQLESLNRDGGGNRIYIQPGRDGSRSQPQALERDLAPQHCAVEVRFTGNDRKEREPEILCSRQSRDDAVQRGYRRWPLDALGLWSVDGRPLVFDVG